MDEIPTKRSGAAGRSSDREAEFGRVAEAQAQGVAGELVAFLRDNKKWWLIPIIVVLLLIGVLVALGGTSAAPFIYTLF